MIEITKLDLLTAERTSQKFRNRIIGGDIIQKLFGEDHTWDIYTINKDGQDISIVAKFVDNNIDPDNNDTYTFKEYDEAYTVENILKRNRRPVEFEVEGFTEPVKLFEQENKQSCVSISGEKPKSLNVQLSPCAEQYFKECAQKHLIQNATEKVQFHGDATKSFGFDSSNGTYNQRNLNQKQLDSRLYIAAQLPSEIVFKDLCARGADINNPMYVERTIEAVIRSNNKDLVGTVMIDMNLEPTPAVRKVIMDNQKFECGPYAAKILETFDRHKDLEQSLAVKPQLKQERRMKI
ncbi:hypothetical protein [Diaphorobacter aerolatus]|uniref:Uncharacterized protein n=1 Tax=Diaphorobacter aerolatus TaxID=1288495 RepID=A0A7H0GJ94_9BURK|nr:hypothetical protein [Diaphorobacter aerolatus]QNP48360.1 hypothetical protein H9K75_20795 [Diaphorobacter aerolatus]